MLSDSLHEHHLTVRRTARVLRAGARAPSRRTALVALHGYAQRAEEILEPLQPLLASDPTLGIVAPEALSRLYRRGATGEEIGASWMTRHDRLHEIEDYLSYLDTVEREMIGEEEEVLLLGFSQGAATAARWALHRTERVARLVAWGGALPLEIANDPARLERMPPTLLVHGKRDPLVKVETLQQQTEALRECGVRAELIIHSGAHAITPEAISLLVEHRQRDEGS